MTENKKLENKCINCDCSFTRLYNLRRHTERKHKNIVAQKCNPFAQKCNPFAQKCNPFAQKCNPFAQNCNPFQENEKVEENQCIYCKKILANKWSLKRHNIKCTDTKESNSYECNFCNKIFNTRNGKSKHLKICKIKNTALIIKPSEDTNINTNNSTQPMVINNNNINNINNNITNNTNNGTINYNIVIYDEKKTNFIKEHITYEKLKFLLNTNTDETVFSKYNSQLMEKEENNCIRKSDKRSNYSQIHIGENKWKNIPDKKIYPEIISQIAGDMQDMVNDKFKNLKSKEKLFDLLDYFIFKETSDDDKETERRYKKIYNLIIEEQKLYAINAAE